jgi:5-hydroxytryptamine receptor 1
LPAIAMFFLYYKIFSIINTRAKKQPSNSVKYVPNKKKKSLATANTNLDSKQQEVNTVLIRNQTQKSKNSMTTSSQSKEKKVTKTLAIVIGCFLTFWFPFFVNNLVTGFCMKFELSCNQNLQSKLTTLFTWLGYMNSCLNPIIYTIFNIEFRKAFVKILRAPLNRLTRQQ